MWLACTPCLNWAWLSLFDTLLAHSFVFRSEEGHHALVHGKNPGEKGHRLAANGGGEVAADSDPFLLLLVWQKFGNPPSRLFYQAQVLVQDGKNHTNRGPICLGKVLYSHPGIFPNWSGDSGDEILGPIALLGIQVVVILLALPPYTLLNMR